MVERSLICRLHHRSDESVLLRNSYLCWRCVSSAACASEVLEQLDLWFPRAINNGVRGAVDDSMK